MIDGKNIAVLTVDPLPNAKTRIALFLKNFNIEHREK